MPNWKPIVGLSFSSEEFDTYCHSLQWNAWRPTFVVLHNTAEPNLANRPNGLNKNHIDNLVKYYRDDKKWSAGPHLFIDDHKIWVFTSLTVSGVHSPSWNKFALGIEMLGNYATEDFNTGRGAAVRKNAVAAMATLCAVLGIDPDTMRLHKEDPNTTHVCPGAKVSKTDVINEVKQLMMIRHGNEHSLTDQ
jgi:N-acetylmuramoyl-L-alanine amidase CwlA